MNNLMKMRMLTGEGDRGRNRGREYRGAYEPMRSVYEPTDARFRDRTGREHYDNGRFAPMRSEYMGGSSGGYDTYGTYAGGYEQPRMGDDDDEDYRRKWTITENRYDTGMNNGVEYNDDGMRRIRGFAVMDGGTRSTYPGPMKGNEMGWRRGSAEKGYSSADGYPPFSRHMAEEWMASIKNEDGTMGPHWTMEQVKNLMQQRGINGDPVKIWTAMNAEYSDMAMIARKYGMDRPEFYLDAAMARWLNDKDAVEDKLAAYYACVVKH